MNPKPEFLPPGHVEWMWVQRACFQSTKNLKVRRNTHENWWGYPESPLLPPVGAAPGSNSSCSKTLGLGCVVLQCRDSESVISCQPNDWKSRSRAPFLLTWLSGCSQRLEQPSHTGAIRLERGSYRPSFWCHHFKWICIRRPPFNTYRRSQTKGGGRGFSDYEKKVAQYHLRSLGILPVSLGIGNCGVDCHCWQQVI